MSESRSSNKTRRVAPLYMLTSQEKSLSRVDRFRTQASSGDRKKTREAFKAAVMRVEGEARWDDKAKLVKEKADWCRRFGEAMDALEVAQVAAEALHLDTEIEEAVLGLIEEAEKKAKEWEERSNTSLVVVEEEPEATQHTAKEVKEKCAERGPMWAWTRKSGQLDALLAAGRRANIKKKVVDAATVKKVVNEAKSRTEDGESVRPTGLKRLRDEDNDSEDEVDGNSNTAPAKTVEGSSVTSREPCDSCKRARVTGECKEYGGAAGAACARCHSHKIRCSWAAGRQGLRKRGKVEVVIPLFQDGKQGVRTQSAKASSNKRALPISLSSDEEDEDVVSENDAPVKSKGKVVMKTVTKMAANGNAATQKERVELHRRLDGLQGRLLQTVAEMNEVRLELAALDEDK